MLFYSEPETFLHIHLNSIFQPLYSYSFYLVGSYVTVYTCHIYTYTHAVVQYIIIYSHQLVVLLKLSLQLYSIQQVTNHTKHASQTMYLTRTIYISKQLQSILQTIGEFITMIVMYMQLILTKMSHCSNTFVNALHP